MNRLLGITQEPWRRLTQLLICTLSAGCGSKQLPQLSPDPSPLTALQDSAVIARGRFW